MLYRTFLALFFVLTMPVLLQSAQVDLPTVQDYRYHKMLLKTARSGDIKAAEVLFAAKADINGQLNHNKTTPLMIAVAKKQKEFVQFLIKHGAKVNLRDIEGRSVLMYTLLLGSDNFEMVKILIAAGADPELKDNKGKTFYDYAKNLKNARQIMYLVKDGRAKYERKLKHMQQSEKALAPIPETEIKIKSSSASEQSKIADQSKSRACLVM